MSILSLTSVILSLSLVAPAVMAQESQQQLLAEAQAATLQQQQEYEMGLALLKQQREAGAPITGAACVALYQEHADKVMDRKVRRRAFLSKLTLVGTIAGVAAGIGTGVGAAGVAGGLAAGGSVTAIAAIFGGSNISLQDRRGFYADPKSAVILDLRDPSNRAFLNLAAALKEEVPTATDADILAVINNGFEGGDFCAKGKPMRFAKLVRYLTWELQDQAEARFGL